LFSSSSCYILLRLHASWSWPPAAVSGVRFG